MDFKEYKVKNELILFGFITAFLYQIFCFGLQGFISYGIGIIVPILILFLLFLLHMLGAGDIKLFSVIGSFFGVEAILSCMYYSFMVGAILSILLLLKKKQFLVRFQYFFHYISDCISSKQIKPYRDEENQASGEGTMHFTLAILSGFLIMILVGRTMN